MDSQEALDSSKPIKRRRLTQACDVCRKKKVKCDGNRPSCSNCIRLNATCTYLPSFKKRGPRQGPPAMEEEFAGGSIEFFRRLSAPSTIQPINIERRDVSVRSSSLPVEASTNMISIPVLSTSYNNFSNFSHIPIPSFDAGGTPFFGNIGSLALPEGPQPYQNERPKEEADAEEEEVVEEESAVREKVEQVWSQSYLGNTSGLHSLSTGGSKEKTPSPKGDSEVLCLVGADSLPPPQITEHLANLYFDVIYPQMPFVHRPTFFRKLKNKEIPPILILSISIVADESTRRGEIFSDRFRDILVLCLDDPCLSTIQALLIFSYYEYTNARISRSWMYLGMAVRMAQELGINRIDEGGSVENQCPSEWVEVETRRRVWWSCFIRDRLVSSGTGRSMAIDEQDTRVLLPCDDRDFNNENPVETVLLDISDNASTMLPSSVSHQSSKKENCIGYRAHWVKLVALLGRVSQFVNSPKFRKSRSSVETLARFTLLENSLTAWSESLPAQFKYPCKVVNEATPSGYSRAAFIICIHMLYHAIIILLHRSNLDMSTAESVVQASWKRCIVSANEIVAAIPELYSYPSCYNYPHISFGIFTAGTVFMHSLYSHMATAVEETKNKLERTYHTLLMLQREWPMAGKYGILLKGLVSIRNRVITQREISVPNKTASTCKAQNPLFPVTLQPPTSGLKFNQFGCSSTEAAPEQQFNLPSESQSPHEMSTVRDGDLEFFDGFQDLADMPFSQDSFFDELMSSLFVNSSGDSSLKNPLVPHDMMAIAQYPATHSQTMPTNTQGLLQE
ncbi:hypothetical protein K493DRAFT_332834 [Basidiobolus meristosporus CBS 931.73]|uniref:Zn(2)-C6 fungal-type domain-containing protein n=1 Tax=Basidiobolus meristosporus CBS 931.73 TaxID=1314790 RepID=A0A1Y1ZAA8_9FUNG|nr:hypothetical protein K493DRAFT_332834 [Basidiobolus meristosporus CBS 931.73]|eukprot:ORY07212.1 hypothetical protein K493DRAFT_332834 [Basidiobolus meristosporus CBS 931.73]